MSPFIILPSDCRGCLVKVGTLTRQLSNISTLKTSTHTRTPIEQPSGAIGVLA